MLHKCPHCSQVRDYLEGEFKRIFMRCKACGREFRAAECSPLTGKDARDRVEILEMAVGEGGKEPAAPLSPRSKRAGHTVPRQPPSDDHRSRKGIFQRIRRKSG